MASGPSGMVAPALLRSLRRPHLSGLLRLRLLVATGFSAFFLFTAIAIGGMAVYELVRSLYGFFARVVEDGEVVTGFIQADHGGQELITGVIKGINTAIIAMAAFELGMGIGKEYGEPDDTGDLYSVVRRAITRFVSLVCIGLVLEALIMVIKYSQLELAGNLGYPVAITAGASVLLLSLGGFLALTHREGEEGRHPSGGQGGEAGKEGKSPAAPRSGKGLRAIRGGKS